ncbi:FAD-binding oxidoreductase [Polynucleobacter sp. Latsch14-2]|jgi:FAD/FMN-containing dehydrogenase|uniref:FAD-binding oxidoreductase n=1 Tax=Polynucleobacter sp. Latsch14-2 TaxID=2576920 RepID=UPI001C0DF019|nr:FAD-binding oxidoreductase [Polynucleobacter sp. Latsch14-2]MBU3614397.1 FAD-binding oxidoreductase [Polynucleobacter sp. Latsch14-2]
MSPTFLTELESILGKNYVLTSAADTTPYLTDWRKRYTGKALAVLLPGNVKEVAAIVKACAKANIAIVPQGGHTGFCGGATPDASGKQVVLNLKRMNQVREIDASNQTISLEAGCILQAVQERAVSEGFLFPLSLGAEGSCMIGGNLATNAGGTNVLRYGNTRDLCLGLEVVTAQGEIWNGLKGLRKDNTGYDLRDLFIGSEGTLGIITAAVMKLHPLPISQWTTLVATEDIAATIALLNLFQKRATSLLTGFEMMTQESLALNEKHFPQMTNPLQNNPPLTILIELSDHESEAHVRQLLESILEEAFEAGIISNAVIASNLSQANSFWHMREHITLAQAAEGANLKHDITIPLSALESFIYETDQLVRAKYPGVRIINFGHLGDGNLHYNIAPPEGSDAQAFNLANEKPIHELIYAQVERCKGSISAEHGVGQLKLDGLRAHKGEVAHELMKTLKRALDPQNILNPHKVVSI